MKRSTLAVLVISGLLLAITARAQEKKMEMPKPGAEVKRLGYFAGKWSGESEMKESPFGPGGKMTSVDTCSWFEGGFQLVCNSTAKGPMGATKGMYYLAYHSEDKVYLYSGIDSMGMAGSAKGTVSGNTWTWTGEEKMHGKVIHSRYTITETSPTSYTFKWETSEDEKTWSTTAEGKSTKLVSKAMPAERKK